MAMHVFDYTSDTFEPISFQPESSGDAFAEVSYLEVLLAEAQRSLKQKSRELASGAKASAPGGASSIAETDITQLLEVTANSHAAGFGVPEPFSPAERAKLARLFGEDDARLSAWEMVLKTLIQSVHAEFPLHRYVMFENRAEELLRTVRKTRAAVAVARRVADIARFAADNFLRLSGEETPKGEAEELNRLLTEFLDTFVALLKGGNEAELRLNLCAFWAERIIPRYQCSFQQWYFLISSLELGIHAFAGARTSRIVSPCFSMLNQAVVRFDFCGVYRRNQAEIEKVLVETAPVSGFDFKRLLRAVLAELLMEESGGGFVSPIQTRILTASELAGVGARDFRIFAVRTVNACRKFVERSWLDWLENRLKKIGDTLEFVENRRKNDADFKKAVALADENLREALDVFRTKVSLARDLTLILDTARQIALIGPTLDEARKRFRYWFAHLFAADQADGIRQHARTVAGALATGLRNRFKDDDFQREFGGAVELLADMPEIVSDAQTAIDALSHVPAEGLAENVSDPTCRRDLVWVVRRTALDVLKSGRNLGPVATSRWMIDEVVPYVSSIRTEDFETAYLELRDAVTFTPGLDETRFLDAFYKVIDEIPASVLSVRLWADSDALAAEAAGKIYAALPEYHAATKEAGLEKCARDNAAVLRRVALALEPDVTDRVGYFESWWTNLINQYIFNRPPRLFDTTRKHVLAVASNALGDTAGTLIDEVIGLVYKFADGVEVGEAEPANRFVALSGAFPLFDGLAGNPHFDLEHTLVPKFQKFLGAGVETAFQYAAGGSRKLPPLVFDAKPSSGKAQPPAEKGEFLEVRLNEICNVLADGFAPFLWSGVPAPRTVAAWKDWTESEGDSTTRLERFLVGFIYHAGNHPDTAFSLQAIDYLQALIEFGRQVRAGAELAAHADELGGLVADQVHGVLGDKLKAGVSSPDKNKCRRDLGLAFAGVAEVLKTQPRPVAMLNVHRWLTEQIGPFIGYGEETWRAVWRSAGVQAERICALQTYLELKSWFESLEGIGSTMPFIGQINRKFVAGEAIFSPNPTEEADWRLAVRTLLALVQVQACAERDLPTIRWILAETLKPAREADFPAKLRAVMNCLREWFIDLDLKPVQAEFDAFERTLRDIESIRKLIPVVDEVRRKLADRLPVLNTLGPDHAINAVMLSAAKNAVLGSVRPASRWTVPAYLRFVSDGMLSALGQADQAVFDRLLAGFGNLLTPHIVPVEQVVEDFKSLRRLGTLESDFKQAWTRQWQIEGKEFNHASCQRDLHWMARRICFDGWIGDEAANGAVGWYVNEIMPFTGQTGSKTYLKALKLMHEKFQISNVLPSAMKSASGEFQNAVGTHLTVTRKIDPATLDEIVEDDSKSLWKVITGKFLRFN